MIHKLIILFPSQQVLFDANGIIKKYESAEVILKEFYDLRLKRYQMRKDYLVGMLGAQAKKLQNQARFITEKIDKKIAIGMLLLMVESGRLFSEGFLSRFKLFDYSVHRNIIFVLA